MRRDTGRASGISSRSSSSVESGGRRRPAPTTCAWGAADESVRGYTRPGYTRPVTLGVRGYTSMSGEFVTLARVVKTQGRIGEVAVEIHSDVPDRFAAGMKLLALDKAGESRREVQIEDLWPHKGLLVLKFAGIDSISDAEALIGSELQVRRAERAQLE